ncbi:hypothetical protein [Paraglaciecola sp. L3A3]|uniref:hypothetical protein n=1 Tax=Paraglaciecola sp. L3A3 TaxID=2686358 RepID=UPI00131DB48B|nr:hypothetical protein [Paraglaciecola sp. L3A3]
MNTVLQNALAKGHGIKNGRAVLSLLKPSNSRNKAKADIVIRKISIEERYFSGRGFLCANPLLMCMIQATDIDNYKGNDELVFFVDAGAAPSRDNRTILVLLNNRYFFKKFSGIDNKDIVIGKVIGQNEISELGLAVADAKV